MSSCGLFTVAYERAPAATRGELRQLYSALCHDETPMVRRAAAQRLGAFAGAVERDVVAKELLSLFTDLTGDGERGGRRGVIWGCLGAAGRYRRRQARACSRS